LPVLLVTSVEPSWLHVCQRAGPVYISVEAIAISRTVAQGRPTASSVCFSDLDPMPDFAPLPGSILHMVSIRATRKQPDRGAVESDSRLKVELNQMRFRV
jgi:hypothetical protein